MFWFLKIFFPFFWLKVLTEIEFMDSLSQIKTLFLDEIIENSQTLNQNKTTPQHFLNSTSSAVLNHSILSQYWTQK